MANATLANGPAQAVRDLAALCRRERLPFAFLLMPECSQFREMYAPSFRAGLDGLFADIRRGGEFELIDARCWVPDDGFWDGHHLHVEGATVFSDRFAREVLPRLKQSLVVASYAHAP
jgi:hypothetical protein